MSMSARQKEVFSKEIGSSPSDILANMDSLNEEISEQAEAAGVALKPVVEAPVEQAQVESLEELNAKLDAALKLQKEAEAAKAEAEAAKAPERTPERTPEQTIEAEVLKLLKEAPGAPSEARINAWKAEYGSSGVQVLSMGKEDVYVFTYLRRKAFQQVQAAINKAQQIEGMSGNPEEMMMEQVIKQCVLFPKLPIEFFYNSRSGVVPTLYSSIMLHSYHLSTQQAMVLTAQL